MSDNKSPKMSEMVGQGIGQMASAVFDDIEDVLEMLQQQHPDEAVAYARVAQAIIEMRCQLQDVVDEDEEAHRPKEGGDGSQ